MITYCIHVYKIGQCVVYSVIKILLTIACTYSMKLYACHISITIKCNVHNCDDICEKVPYCGTNIVVGPNQTPRMMRAV